MGLAHCKRGHWSFKLIAVLKGKAFQVPARNTVRGEAHFPQPRQCNQTTVGNNLGESNPIPYSLQVNRYPLSLVIVIEFARTEIDQNFEELKNLQDFLISSFPWVFKDSKVYCFRKVSLMFLTVCGTEFSQQLQHPPTGPGLP